MPPRGKGGRPPKRKLKTIEKNEADVSERTYDIPGENEQLKRKKVQDKGRDEVTNLAVGVLLSARTKASQLRTAGEKKITSLPESVLDAPLRSVAPRLFHFMGRVLTDRLRSGSSGPLVVGGRGDADADLSLIEGGFQQALDWIEGKLPAEPAVPNGAGASATKASSEAAAAAKTPQSRGQRARRREGVEEGVSPLVSNAEVASAAASQRRPNSDVEIQTQGLAGVSPPGAGSQEKQTEESTTAVKTQGTRGRKRKAPVEPPAEVDQKFKVAAGDAASPKEIVDVPPDSATIGRVTPGQVPSSQKGPTPGPSSVSPRAKVPRVAASLPKIEPPSTPSTATAAAPTAVAETENKRRGRPPKNPTTAAQGPGTVANDLPPPTGLPPKGPATAARRGRPPGPRALAAAAAALLASAAEEEARKKKSREEEEDLSEMSASQQEVARADGGTTPGVKGRKSRDSKADGRDKQRTPDQPSGASGSTPALAAGKTTPGQKETGGTPPQSPEAVLIPAVRVATLAATLVVNLIDQTPGLPQFRTRSGVPSSVLANPPTGFMATRALRATRSRAGKETAVPPPPPLPPPPPPVPAGSTGDEPIEPGSMTRPVEEEEAVSATTMLTGNTFRRLNPTHSRVQGRPRKNPVRSIRVTLKDGQSFDIDEVAGLNAVPLLRQQEVIDVLRADYEDLASLTASVVKAHEKATGGRGGMTKSRVPSNIK